MSLPDAPKYGVKFLTRQERTVKRVTKCATREIQKRLEPPKPVRVRPPPKPKVTKKPVPPATLRKPITAPREKSTSNACKQRMLAASRTLQLTDLEKLARLSCSREFGLFHQSIKPELSKSHENQLAFLQTKLQHLKNEFTSKHAEHLNFEQIKDYYTQAVQEHVRRHIKPDEYRTMAEKFRQDTKLAIDKWLKKKEFKPPKQMNEFLQRRQERIRDQIKETIVEQKKQQELNRQAEMAAVTASSITIRPAKPVGAPEPVDIVILD